MKRYLFIVISLLVVVSVHAQRGGGRGGRGMGGGGVSREMPSPSVVEFIVDFPEIPDFSPTQKGKVSPILIQEKKEVDKQVEKKLKSEEKLASDLSAKNQEKEKKNIADADKKIAEIKDKSNKKIQKELGAEQYRVFLEKRDEIQFTKAPQPQGRQGGAPGGAGRRP